MIEIHINKDVGSYEAKFIGPFTLRQTICICIAAPICWLIYKIASPYLSGDAAGFLIFLPAVVAWAFGWLKPYGMRPEKFIQSVFINMVLAPANRKYKAATIVDDVVYSLELDSGAAESVKTVSDICSAPEESNEGKKKKSRKPRYKVSPEAVR